MNQSFGSAIVLPQPIYNFFGAARSDFGTSKHRHVSGLRACPARSGSGREHGRSEINYTEMKTQEPHQPLTDEDDEVTLVAPRFDDEETIVARRVVPLEEVGRDAPAVAARARPHSRSSSATRPRWRPRLPAPRRRRSRRSARPGGRRTRRLRCRGAP